MDLTSLPTVADRVGYLPASARHPRYTIYPPSAGRPSERPPIEYHAAVFHDCRPVLDELLLDRDGLAFRRTAAARQPTARTHQPSDTGTERKPSGMCSPSSMCRARASRSIAVLTAYWG